jgi:hypothetical protein
MYAEAVAYFITHGEYSVRQLKEKICLLLEDGDEMEALRLDAVLSLVEEMAIAANPKGQNDENIGHHVESVPSDSA